MSIKEYFAGLFQEAEQKERAKKKTSAERYADLCQKIASGEDQPAHDAVLAICRAVGKDLKTLEKDVEFFTTCQRELANLQAANETLARRPELTKERGRLETELKAAIERVQMLKESIRKNQETVQAAIKRRDRALSIMRSLPFRSPEANNALSDEIEAHRAAKAAAKKASEASAVKRLSWKEANEAIAKRGAFAKN